MKKFLSLVLAMIMTLSLVTISAGATEYKDLTDKDEIQYEEAVAVLNRIGIITGYSDGSFRPETELTRGAAAKIIVSLLIGADAANNLTVPVAPYPDVPTSHTFAAVISYCKTAKIISGYSDGTFKPDGSLTGYAFAKMLLGAIGYKSELEGFSGSGWTMNVAKIGNAAGLFNRLNFQGGDAVNREQACQLALNTLKATMVEYTGGFNVVAGDATIVGAQNRSYVTSNQSYAANINNKKVTDTGNNTSSESHYTVEFGEEHFKDLRLNYDGNTNDDFGRPANNWSWKKVTIGTFALDADFSYDKRMEHRDKTSAAKNRATGLSGFKTVAPDAIKNGNSWDDAYTRVWVNGFLLNGDGAEDGSDGVLVNADGTFDSGSTPSNTQHQFGIADISDLTDNGSTVDVYVSEDNADFITDVVVVKSQLMEVKKIGSDYVSLQMYDNSTSDDEGSEPDEFPGFNQKAINYKVENVQAEDAMYPVLKDLKVEDRVVVIPVADDPVAATEGDTDWNVAEAYVPETVSGALTAVGDYGPTNTKKNAISLTVGGTVYDVSLWNKDIEKIDGDKIKVTKKDVTLTLDKHGYAMLAEDVGATNDFMIVGSFRSGIENGRIVTYVTGWDIDGEEIELNVGPNYNRENGIVPGDLVKYSSATNSNVTDWTISESDVYNVFTGVDTDIIPNAPYEIKASNQSIKLVDYGDDSKLYFDKSIKFIYVTFDVDGEVESIEVKKDVQAVENKELRTTGAAYRGPIGAGSTYDTNGVINYSASGNLTPAVNSYNSAQACVSDKGAVKAVVIKQESNDAISSAMLYVRDMPGGAEYDSEGKMVYKYTVAMNGKDGLVDDEMTIYSYDRLYRGDFASYTEMTNDKYDKTPFYDLRQHNDFTKRTTSTFQADFLSIVNENRGYVRMSAYKTLDGKTTLSGGDAPNVAGPQKASLGLGDEANIGIIKNAVFVDLTDNDIDSYDDLKTFMYYDFTAKKDSKVRQNTVTVHMVVNDNTDNDGFRKVAMVVVTDVDKGNVDTAANTVATLDTAFIKGVNYTANKPGANASVNIGDLTVKAAGSTAATRFTFSGKSMEIKLNGTKVDDGFTNTLGNGDVILVTVTPYSGADVTYTFNIQTPVAPQYNNSTVREIFGTTDAGGQNYTASEWDNTAAGDVKVNFPSFEFPFLNTGVESETLAQLNEAIAYWNDANSATEGVELGAPVKNGAVYTIPYGNTNISFNPEATGTKYMIKYADDSDAEPTEKIFAKGTKVEDSSGVFASSTGTPSITLVGGNEEPLTGTLSSTEIVAGATYVKEAYTAVNKVANSSTTPDTITATGTSTGKYTYTFTPGTGVASDASNWYLKKDQVITFTVTMDVANSTMSTKTDTFTLDGTLTAVTVTGTAAFTASTTADSPSAEITIKGGTPATAISDLAVKVTVSG